MCFKRWFSKPDPITPEFTDNTVCSIVVGNYPGTANDLDGPPYDQINFEKDVLKQWPNYTFRNFKDSESTKERFFLELNSILDRMKSGDLLLFIMDNCFSESNTRDLLPGSFVEARVYHNPKFPDHKGIIQKVISDTKGLHYLAMSACLDHETAADAVIDGIPGGSFTVCLRKTMKKGITYKQWDSLTCDLLHKLGFDQTCTIEGPDDLMNREIFEGTVYVMYVSSHGSHVYDTSGDEPDKQDEGPYLYDGMIIDDEIGEVLKRLPE